MKTRLYLLLTACLLLISFSLPVWAGDPAALEIKQNGTCEPGQPVTLSVCVPKTEMAGGFICFTYDASLFTLSDVTLTQATDILHLTYQDLGGRVNILLDGAQNAEVSGELITICFQTNEEIQPGSYSVFCTVPDAASFYALAEDGSTAPLGFSGCEGLICISEPILPVCPARYLACQETEAFNGLVSVRLCALVETDATFTRGSYGFTCSVTDKDGTKELTLGGSEITDSIEGGGHVYGADELGGSIYTSTVSIPGQGEVRITLAPYVRTDGQTLYGPGYTLHYKNGIYLGTTQ